MFIVFLQLMLLSLLDTAPIHFRNAQFWHKLLILFHNIQRDNELRQVERRCQDQVDAEKRRVKETEQQLAAVKQQLDRASEGLEAAARYTFGKGEGT
jgi:hypothetical protein